MVFLVYVCSMENTKVKHGEDVIESGKLFTLSEYARQFNVPISTVKYQMLSGSLKTLKVNGSTLIIRED